MVAKSNRKDVSMYLPFWMHAEDTAGIMLELWYEWVPELVRRRICEFSDEAAIQKTCQFFGLTHDYGKMSILFQSKILQSMDEARTRLEKAGIHLLTLEHLRHSAPNPHAWMGEEILSSLGCPDSLSVVVGAHHGRPVPHKRRQIQVDPATFYGSQKEVWETLWQEWLVYVWGRCEAASWSDFPELSPEAQTLLSGLLIMADWIASNTYYFPLIDNDDLGHGDAYPQRVEDAWNKLNLPSFWSSDAFGMDEENFREHFGFRPNAVQKAVLQSVQEAAGPALYILEAQMGVGKTEAALAAAEILAQNWGCGGIFFGLPTQATANGIFPRLLSWAEGRSTEMRNSVRLAHGMAEMNEDYRALFQGQAVTEEDAEQRNGLVVHPWFKGRKQALLANFAVGTIDQFLMASLNQRHVMLRHLGLAGKVIILDECHAYDAYMNAFLDRSLEWLAAYGTPVIILSATLPTARRVELVRAYQRGRQGAAALRGYEGQLQQNSISEEAWQHTSAYPVLTWTDGSFKTEQRVIPTEAVERELSVSWTTDDELIPLIQEALSDGGCAALILNTVKRAQACFVLLREACPNLEIKLFHSRFMSPDRAEKERELLQRLGKNSEKRQRDGLLVIGTQVLEQSLDIDVDLMLTDLCPMDLLMQRIGRLQRHRRHDAMRPRRLREARCYVIQAADGTFESGAKAIYQEWPLAQTRRILQELGSRRIALPRDISELVQEAYRFPAEEDEQLHVYRLKREKSRRLAEDNYCIRRPGNSDSFRKILAGSSGSENKWQALASVREGRMELTVLLFQLLPDGVHYLPWRENGARIPFDCLPSAEEERLILSQNIRLPQELNGKEDQTIAELEKQTLLYCPEWQYSQALKEELILFLDENLSAELGGQKLTYSRELGLLRGVCE